MQHLMDSPLSRVAGSWALVYILSACSTHAHLAASIHTSTSDGGEPGAAGVGESDQGGTSGTGGTATGGTGTGGADGGSGATGGSGTGGTQGGSQGVSGTGGSGGSGQSSGGGGHGGGASGRAAGGSAGAGGKKPVSTGKPPACPSGNMLSGQTGMWEDVTPSAVTLDKNFTGPVNNYGVQDVLADPSCPGRFYAFICYQGVWVTTDYGATWTQADTDNQLEQGRPWGEAIASDGSYMLACTGYGNGRVGAWKSIDGGATWKAYPIADNSDPYMFDIDPTDNTHVISTSHSVGHVYESMDAGETWSDAGDTGVPDSPYAFFITPTTWLLVTQDDHGTMLTTDSGKTWSKVGDMQHVHGAEQIFIDPNNSDIYVPSHNGVQGVYRSTDNGATFKQVSTGQGAAVVATDSTLYSIDSGASTDGNPPNPFTSPRADGTKWTAMTFPSAMTNGTKRAGVAQDPVSKKWVIVSGNWNAGIWRYLEP